MSLRDNKTLNNNFIKYLHGPGFKRAIFSAGWWILPIYFNVWFQEILVS